MEALEEAVTKYKVLARQVEPHSDQAKDVIRRLVQLRMKLFEAKVVQIGLDSDLWCFEESFRTKISM